MTIYQKEEKEGGGGAQRVIDMIYKGHVHVCNKLAPTHPWHRQTLHAQTQKTKANGREERKRFADLRRELRGVRRVGWGWEWG